MIFTVEFVVTYKDAPKEPQQRAIFKVREAALAFAIAVENSGGIAVFTEGYKPSITSDALPYPSPSAFLGDDNGY